MKRSASYIIIVGYTSFIGGVQAQDTGIGLNDTRTTPQQQTAIANARESGNELAKLAVENGGVSSAIQPFAEAAGKAIKDAYELTKSTASENAGGLLDTVMDAYSDSMENADLAGGTGNNADLANAGNFADAKACEFFPASCANKPKQSSAAKEPKITDRGVLLRCNPLNVSVGDVVANKNIVYRNECNWGVADRRMPGGFRGDHTSIISCNGWDRFTIVQTVPGIPRNARGYAGTTVDISPVTNRPETYDNYRGPRYGGPCHPSESARNPLAGGCLNLGILRVGSCN